MSRYLDPKSDVVFKRIFGEHPHLLKNFLNALLPLSEKEQIESLEYLPAEQAPKIPEFKRSIVDVKCVDKQGRFFIVEMQMEWTNCFMQRMLFNSAQAYVKQLRPGDNYKFLCPVYGLGLINSEFDKTSDWYHHYKIIHSQNPEKQLKGLEFVFLELPKFKPSTPEEKRLRALWIRFLKEIGHETVTVDADFLNIPEINEACTLCEIAAYSRSELAVYESYWDFVSTTKTLESGRFDEGKEVGKQEGIAIGKEVGKQEGITLGKQEGIEMGRKAEQIEIAKQLLIRGFDLSGIVAVTKLSLPELQTLHDQLMNLVK